MIVILNNRPRMGMNLAVQIWRSVPATFILGCERSRHA